MGRPSVVYRFVVYHFLDRRSVVTALWVAAFYGERSESVAATSTIATIRALAPEASDKIAFFRPYAIIPPVPQKSRKTPRRRKQAKTKPSALVAPRALAPARLRTSKHPAQERTSEQSSASGPGDFSPAVSRIFLLSPANASGIRAKLILREQARFPLALRLRDGKLTLGEAFSFISGLYFRGKLAYARAFAQPPPRSPGALVITACGGLLSPDVLLTRDALCAISAAPVSASETRYLIPLERDARQLAEQVGPQCEVVLLGSVATPKYVEPLSRIFGERLRFPAEFAGRGDMSRGGLMLRCARSGVQLTYVPVATAQRHGSRPPKLPPMPFKWSILGM